MTSTVSPEVNGSGNGLKNADSNASNSVTKCDACGSTSIDIDPSRAETVCTNCGNVLDSNMIVSDIQFEENAHGGSSTIGQFVSADAKGGGMEGGGSLGSSGFGRSRGGFGGGISGIGRESREITLRNARNKIKALGQQLSLSQDRIEIAFNFFKMALRRNLTRGRKSTHVIAACVYITCRTERTSHMLIDFSDILQIDVYELGRTYLRLSQELYINIPAMDPCLYIMRFAHKLEFANKTHEVSMTALRLVSRMKKDWIHFGRRPSGLCGAALLIAARLHSFHRTVNDVIKVVKVHESTLRKRLNEFGETPASQLTLDEFMNVDLDAMTEEQDPPSFKVARKKDKERLSMLEDTSDFEDEMSELRKEIEKQLEERRAKIKGPYSKYSKDSSSTNTDSEDCIETSLHIRQESMSEAERNIAEKFIAEQTLGTISEIVNDKSNEDSVRMPPPSPSIKNRKGVVASPGLGLKDTIQEYLIKPSPSQDTSSDKNNEELSKEDSDGELDMTGIDDDEIDDYIMSDKEIKFKTEMWMRVNADYLKEKAEKEEKERREEEEAAKEGREIKKKKRVNKKNKINLGGNQTAIEAIEKIVQEKKISTKINYDVLRSLNMDSVSESQEEPSTNDNSSEEAKTNQDEVKYSQKRSRSESESSTKSDSSQTAKKVRKPTEIQESHPLANVEPIIEKGPVVSAPPEEEPEEEEEDYLEDEDDESCMSAAQLLSKHRGDDDEEEFYEEEYDEY